jgi:hypothetical protein
MTNYHFLSHLNYVDLANPICPLHEGSSSDMNHRRRKGKTGSGSHTHQPDLVEKSIDV